MVGNSWTTPEQRAYLKLNLPQYEAAQASKKTTLYADELCLRFLDKFREYWDGTNNTPHNIVKKVSVFLIYVITWHSQVYVHRSELKPG